MCTRPSLPRGRPGNEATAALATASAHPNSDVVCHFQHSHLRAASLELDILHLSTRFPTIRPNVRESGRACVVIVDVTESQKRHRTARWPALSRRGVGRGHRLWWMACKEKYVSHRRYSFYMNERRHESRTTKEPLCSPQPAKNIASIHLLTKSSLRLSEMRSQ